MAEPDRHRIAARLEALWEIRRGPAGGADRPAYSPAEAAAMRLVAGWARDAGLDPGVDRHGNLWAAPPAGAVASSGSHVDTVPDGGRADGALGTVLALEAAACLPAGAQPAVLVCAAEEASRFGSGTIGSRLLAGTLQPRELEDMHDGEGVSAAAALAGFLEELAELPRLDRIPLEELWGHVEVHVEQRWSLRARGAQLGVVERVAVPHRYELVVDGQAGHAGEVPMAERRDALAAAAELVSGLELAALAAPPPTMATVGSIRVEPGAVSVVPGRATLQLEVRGIEATAIAAVETGLWAACKDVSERRGVRIDRRCLRGGAPVTLDPGLAEAAVAAAERRGISAVRTHSGAGHDVQHLAQHAPAALLFVPLAGGESHTPAETADGDDVAAAAAVLIDLLEGLAAQRVSVAPDRNSSSPNS